MRTKTPLNGLTREVSIFVDTKNYSSANNMFKDLGQYKAYLQNIDDFDQVYIIQQGGRGVTQAQVINKLQSVLKKEDNMEDIFDIIWSKQEFRKSVFGNILDEDNAFEIFSKSINDKTSKLFDSILITM